MRSWFPGRKLLPVCGGAPFLVLLLAIGYAPRGHAELYRCTTPEGGMLLTDKACADNPMAAHETPTPSPAPQASAGKPKHAVPATTAPPSPAPQATASKAKPSPAPPTASQASAGKPKHAVTATTLPPSPAPQASAGKAKHAVPATESSTAGDDARSELAQAAYLRAMGEHCSLPAEHTQVLRFLDMLANNRLAIQGVRLTPEETKRLADTARERAQHDVAGARQSACASADRSLVDLGQTRVQFQVLPAPAGG